MASEIDPLSMALAEARERNEGRITAMLYTEYTVEHHAAEGDVRRLLAALGAVLAPHQPRTVVLFGRSCITHRPLKPVPGCVLCTQDEHRQVCPECRDEFGDPVPFEDCRARKAALAALTGKEAGGGS